MASGDDEYQDDSSSGFFPDDLDRSDPQRDLYAILHINRDVSILRYARQLPRQARL